MSRGLCDHDYPDEVCRSNYSKHAYDPPLLYNLHHDPGEIYPLDTTMPEYQVILKTIMSVSILLHCSFLSNKSQNMVKLNTQC